MTAGAKHQITLLGKPLTSGSAMLPALEEMVLSGQAPANDQIDAIKDIITQIEGDLNSTQNESANVTADHIAAVAGCNANVTTRNDDISASTGASVSKHRSEHKSCRLDLKSKSDHNLTNPESSCRKLISFLDAVTPEPLPFDRP